jgi:hypothetical protein
MLDIDDDDEELILDDEELDNPKPKGRNFKAKGGCDHKSCPNGKNCFK